jgi:hypothetical protein
VSRDVSKAQHSPSLSKPGAVRTPSLNLAPRMVGRMGMGKNVIR